MTPRPIQADSDGSPFSSIESVITAYWATVISPILDPPSSTDAPATTSSAPSSEGSVFLTQTVQTTVLSTAFVTEYQSTATVSSSPTTKSTNTPSTTQTSLALTKASETSSSSATSSDSASTSLPIGDPSSVSPASSISSSDSSSSVYTPTAIAATSGSASSTPAATPSAIADARPSPSHHKHVIIGGLAGTIAGLILIGLLVCLCLRRRRRRRRDEGDDQSTSEKGAGMSFVRGHYVRGRGGKPVAIAATPGRGSKPVTVAEMPRTRTNADPRRVATPAFVEDNVIRMSLDHFQRPFVGNEGWRDSVAPGRLRVTNPDASRPATPQSAAEHPGHFLGRQRSALATMLAPNRSRAASTASQAPPQSSQNPQIHIDPALSQECIVPSAATPSFRSYPPVNMTPMVVQRPPEDPFLTPPDDGNSTPRQQRPNLAPLQSGRSRSYFNTVLHPFRTKSSSSQMQQQQQQQQQGQLRSYSGQSVTSAYSSRLSRPDTMRSDPFDLDRPSSRGSSVLQGAEVHEHAGRRATPKWALYEGT